MVCSWFIHEEKSKRRRLMGCVPSCQSCCKREGGRVACAQFAVEQNSFSGGISLREQTGLYRLPWHVPRTIIISSWRYSNGNME